MKNNFNSDYYKDYLKSQTNICFNCDLFDDKNVHGSKIIMLFAEIFPFLTDIYGIKNSSSLIINYSNSDNFKHWFWRIKHILGTYLGRDPSFDDIGKWIGKGFFIKICISLLIYHKLYIGENIINELIKKQKNLLKELIKEEGLTNKYNLIKNDNEQYYILNEKIILSYNNEYFYFENLIS